MNFRFELSVLESSSRVPPSSSQGTPLMLSCPIRREQYKDIYFLFVFLSSSCGFFFFRLNVEKDALSFSFLDHLLQQRWPLTSHRAHLYLWRSWTQFVVVDRPACFVFTVDFYTLIFCILFLINTYWKTELSVSFRTCLTLLVLNVCDAFR